MQSARMLVSTATVLAATAVAWQGGPPAGAQEPEKPKTSGSATREYKIVVGKEAGPGAAAVGDVKAFTVDGPDKPAQAGGREIRKEIRVIRGQEADATRQAAERGQATILGLRHDDTAVLDRLMKLHAGGPDDPHREVILKLRTLAHESCVQCHAGGVSVRQDDALGLTLVPADETLRSQLKLDGKGLVVTAVAHGSSGERAGVKEKDILVAGSGKPLTTVDDFKAIMKTPDADPSKPATKAVVIRLIRGGEAKEIRTIPATVPTVLVGRVLIPNAASPKGPSYWIGVSIDDVDDTLREHLKLADKVGLVISDVLKDSPAAKVGLEKNDVLLKADGTPLKAPGDLVKAVQATKGEATLRLSLRRAGDEREIAVRPEKRMDPEPTAAVPAPPSQLGYKELRLGDGPHGWVTQLVPFLDAKQANTIWATPGADGRIVIMGQLPHQVLERDTLDHTPLNAEAKKAAEVELKKATDASHVKMAAEYERYIATLRAQEADRKVMSDWIKKAAVPGETLARIDAQLKALETQVGEIKRSMDELKATLKKDAQR